MFQIVDFALIDNAVALDKVGEHFEQRRFRIFFEFHKAYLLGCNLATSKLFLCYGILLQKYFFPVNFRMFFQKE